MMETVRKRGIRARLGRMSRPDFGEKPPSASGGQTEHGERFWRRHPLLASLGTALVIYVVLFSLEDVFGLSGGVLAIVLCGIALRSWWWVLTATLPFLALASLGVLAIYVAPDPVFIGLALTLGVMLGVQAALSAGIGVGIGLLVRCLHARIKRAAPVAVT